MGVSRKELQQLAETRLKEAKILARNNMYDGARYLAGYVVELALKAKICFLLELSEYPDAGNLKTAFRTHSYDDLIKLAGLETKLKQEQKENKNFGTNWDILTKWTPDYRYKPVGSQTKAELEKTIKALENPKSGVFRWIKRNWKKR
ncbi:MAG: hypothetical protein Kow0090_02470 [Myxococcota bacterium]